MHVVEKLCGTCNWAGKMAPGGEDRCDKCGLFKKNWSPLRKKIVKDKKKTEKIKRKITK